MKTFFTATRSKDHCRFDVQVQPQLPAHLHLHLQVESAHRSLAVSHEYEPTHTINGHNELSSRQCLVSWAIFRSVVHKLQLLKQREHRKHCNIGSEIVAESQSSQVQSSPVLLVLLPITTTYPYIILRTYIDYTRSTIVQAVFPIPISYFLFPISCFLFPVSCFLFPVSCFLFPVSFQAHRLGTSTEAIRTQRLSKNQIPLTIFDIHKYTSNT